MATKKKPRPYRPAPPPPGYDSWSDVPDDWEPESLQAIRADPVAAEFGSASTERKPRDHRAIGGTRWVHYDR